MPVPEPRSDPKRCLNCDAPLEGHWCHACGQEDTPAVPTFGMLCADLWENVVSVDRKLLRTVFLLLFRPGAATVEHLAGRRTRTVSPYKIYFWTTALLVTVAFQGFYIEDKDLLEGTESTPARGTTAPPTVSIGAKQGSDPKGDPEKVRVVDLLDRPVTLLGTSLDPKRIPSTVPEYEAAQARLPEARRDAPLRRFVTVKWIRLRASPADFLRNLIYGSLPNILLLAAPLWAVAMLPLFRKPRRRYVEHLVFSLHTHTVAVWMALGAVGLGALGRWFRGAPEFDPSLLFAGAWTLHAFHTFLAARRTYAEAWPGLVLKGGCLVGCHVVLVAIAVTVGLLLTLGANLLGL
ncbi:MAG: DUF3667 domain-containing protein [Armatimonadota bacterium]